MSKKSSGRQQTAPGREAGRGLDVMSRNGPLQAEKPERGKVRLSLDISPELNDLLEELAETSGVSKSDVLRRAITLMKIAVDAKQTGKKFGIAEKDQTIATEIIWL